MKLIRFISSHNKKTGLACVGNWVLDRSKFLDYYPEINGHTTIQKSVPCPGGGALNVLMALSKLEAKFPTYGIGVVGTTLRAQELMRLCRTDNINTDYVQMVEGQSSFTDAMILPDGSRTQFHCPGVNDLLNPEHVPIHELKKKKVKLFYLGHLMILAGMDAKDKIYGTKSAKLLHDIQQAGMETVIDFVSNPSKPYDKLVAPAIPYTDHVVCNEFEAEQLSGIKTREIHGRLTHERLQATAKKIFKMGAKKSVVIHSPEIAYCLLANNKEYHQQSLNIPPEKIIGSCGAGDAFCAGILYGLHENWPMQKTLLLANCTAAASLTRETNSDGIKSLEETLALAKIWKPAA